MCCRSRHVKFWLASNTNAAIPAASGADADVPVCEIVHEWCKSVVTTCRSSLLPLLYVVANVELHFSEYHGTKPRSVALDIDNVQIEFVYPSQLQLSWSLPPFPEAHIKMLPFPLRPFVTPSINARVANSPVARILIANIFFVRHAKQVFNWTECLPGPSTVFPSSSGPHDALYMSDRKCIEDRI